MKSLTTLSLILLGLSWLSGCGNGSSASPSPKSPEEIRKLWHRGVAEMDQHKFIPATATFRQILSDSPLLPEAWTNLGISLMNQVTKESFLEAEKAFRKALEGAPKHPVPNHCLGILLKHLGRYPEARPHFENVLAVDPFDPTANYYLATLLVDANDLLGARRHLERAIAAEPHMSSAVHKLFQLSLQQGKSEGQEALVQVFKELSRTGTGNTASIVYTEMGRYGTAIARCPVESAPTKSPPRPPRYVRVGSVVEDQGFPGAGRPAEVAIPPNTPPREVFGGTFARTFGPGASLSDVDQDGDLDLYVADGVGLGQLLLNDGKGNFVDASATWGLSGGAPSISGVFGDIDNDGDQDLYVACAGPNRLLRNDGSRFSDITDAAGVSGGDVFTSQAVMSDLDSDGDVDIYVANLVRMDGPSTETLRTWPRDFEGAPNILFNNNRDGTWTDITERTLTGGLERRSTGVVAADFDGDRDADLYVLNEGQENLLLRNDRIWRYASAGTGIEDQGRALGTAVADRDGDGRIDILLVMSEREPMTAWINGGRLEFSTDPVLEGALADTRGTTAVFYDADNDGDLDLAVAGGDVAKLLLREGSIYIPAPPETLAPLVGGWLRSLVAADLDQDGLLDLVASRSGAAPIVLLARQETPGNHLHVVLRGVREEGKTRANAGGLGAQVEVVAKGLRQTQQVLSTNGVLGGAPEVLHFGLGTTAEIDYVRIVWPDDVVQSETQISANQKKVITEVQRKGSSCPLLFTWTGTRWDFVTDFLGTGGLGFFLEPGLYAPPDPTELVAIPALEPKDGAWELRIHEPMEEVLYLDAVELLVVDHADDVLVYPDERMAVEGAAPAGRIWAIHPHERIFPKALRTLGGEADVSTVLDVDRRYQPGVHPDPRFLGYAAPQSVELDFGSSLAQASTDRPLVLFLDGWVEYPYSHVNFAAWQAGLRFEACSLDAEAAPGIWTTVFSEFGYPAGMPRTMTLDVSALPRNGTGRVRLRTNIELYIDRIFLAQDLGSSAYRVTPIVAEKALLRASGYPREYSPDGRLPLLYDYALMDPAIEFKTMAGSYTRFGDVAPLLGAADDRYVIMGRGEEIVVRFPLLPRTGPGTTRSFILKSDGYCKDMDLYTAFPHTVDPLPFHGMSSYPYPPSESYPKSDAHREYSSTWNVRTLEGSR